MKNIHFCTEKLLNQIYSEEQKSIITYRTGWIPQIFTGDIINLNKNNPRGKDFFIRKGEIISIIPLKFRQIPDNTCNEEILRYRRKFHTEQFFFKITIKLLKIEKKQLKLVI